MGFTASLIFPSCKKSTSSGNRTRTSLRKLDFESSASTNSAIEAIESVCKFKNIFQLKHKNFT